jgi:hypothetical protein
LNSLQEDHTYLSDKYNTLYHTTSQKLAARATELTTCERQVESLAAELYDAHEAAVSQSAEILRLQSALDAHELKKQIGPCCAPSLRARRTICVTSRQPAPS